MLQERNDIVRSLQREVLSLQGSKRGISGKEVNTGLRPLEKAFPEQTFPTGAVHEFISHGAEAASATNGFIAGVTGLLMQSAGTCVWISTKRTIFPSSLKLFGIEPERIIFIDLARQKDALWCIEEALKCGTLSTVIGELTELSFKESRRLQLAVEQSRVTGLIHRYNPRAENTVACITRWKIKPVPSAAIEGLPGVGFPRWNVQLQKVRNGKPGAWDIEWVDGGFRHVQKPAIALPGTYTLKTG